MNIKLIPIHDPSLGGLDSREFHFSLVKILALNKLYPLQGYMSTLQKMNEFEWIQKLYV